MLVGCVGSLAMDHERQMVRRHRPYELPPGSVAGAVLHASLELGEGQDFGAVIVPADLRWDMIDCLITQLLP